MIFLAQPWAFLLRQRTKNHHEYDEEAKMQRVPVANPIKDWWYINVREGCSGHALCIACDGAGAGYARYDFGRTDHWYCLLFAA